MTNITNLTCFFFKLRQHERTNLDDLKTNALVINKSIDFFYTQIKKYLFKKKQIRNPLDAIINVKETVSCAIFKIHFNSWRNKIVIESNYFDIKNSKTIYHHS